MGAILNSTYYSFWLQNAKSQINWTIFISQFFFFIIIFLYQVHATVMKTMGEIINETEKSKYFNINKKEKKQNEKFKWSEEAEWTYKQTKEFYFYFIFLFNVSKLITVWRILMKLLILNENKRENAYLQKWRKRIQIRKNQMHYTFLLGFLAKRERNILLLNKA